MKVVNVREYSFCFKNQLKCSAAKRLAETYSCHTVWLEKPFHALSLIKLCRAPYRITQLFFIPKNNNFKILTLFVNYHNKTL